MAARIVRTAAFAAVVCLYLVPFPHFDFLRSPNELSRLYQVRALVDDGTFAVNGPVKRFGRVGDLSEKEGRLYPNKAPGVSFLGAPVYAVLKAVRGGAANVSNTELLLWLRWLVCALPTLLLLGPLRRWAARLAGDARAADAAILVYALGTLAYPYSLLFFSHQPAAVLLAAAFLLLESTRDGTRPMRRFLAGLAAGGAVVCEYTVAPVVAMLLLYAVAASADRLRAAALFVLGGIPCAVLLGGYHEAAWGSAFATGYAHVENRTFAEWHAQGFMGVTVPSLPALLGNLFHPGRGLFAFSPALVVAFAALPALFRREAEGRLLTAVAAFYLFVAAAFLYQAWGWMLGPRHLTPLIPFLVGPLAVGLATLRRRAADGGGWALLCAGAAGLVLASVLVNGLSSLVFPHVPEHYVSAFGHLILPLVQDGLFPRTVFDVFLGASPAWVWPVLFTLLAFVALVATAWTLEPTRLWRQAVIAASTAAAFVLATSVLPPGPTAGERDTNAWIRKHWEPAKRR